MSKHALSRTAGITQALAMALLILAAAVSFITTILAFSGLLPWPAISIAYGGADLPWFGQALQIGITALLILLAATFPSMNRVMRLEHSHRRFEIGMDDITRAYRRAHAVVVREELDDQAMYQRVLEQLFGVAPSGSEPLASRNR